MRPGRLAILALLVLGLFAFIWFFERKQPTTDQLRESQGKLFPQLATERVKKVTVHNQQGEFVLQKEGSSWKLVQPIQDDANSGVVTALVSQLAGLKAESTLDAAQLKLADYGLDTPQKWVRLEEEGGKTYQVSFGQEMPLGNTVAALTDGRQVYLVSKWVAADVDKDLNGFRSTDLLPFFTADVNALTVVGPAGRWAAARSGSLWQLTEPVADLADREEVEGVLSELAAARIKEFLDQGADLAALGLASPRLSLTLVRKEGSPLALSFGQERQGSAGKEVACRRGERVFWVEATALTHLLKEPATFRSGKLLQFSTWQVDSLTLQKGENKVVLQRKDGVWRNAQGQEVDSSPIFSRLATLGDLKVLAFDQPEPQGTPLGSCELTGEEGLSVQVRFFASSEPQRLLALVKGRPKALAVDQAKVEEVLASLPELGKPRPSPTAPAKS
jgi:hypothetical protein